MSGARVRTGSAAGVWIVVAAAALMPGCSGVVAGSAPGDAGVPGDTAPGDAGGMNGSMDGGPGDAGTVGDAGGDSPPVDPGPFPRDPAGGEFAWAISSPGAGDVVSVATDGEGSIFVVATQTAAVTLGALHVAPPTSPAGLLVLKLAPDGKPLWARTLDGATQVYARAIAATPAGDVVIGGEFQGTQLQLGASSLTNAGQADGFVAMLSGSDGAPRWGVALGSAWDDHVAGVGAGLDGAGDDAIYVYGQVAQGTVVGAQPISPGAYLIRFDADGSPRWVASYPALNPGFYHTLAVDPQRGPVITGTFAGTLTLGSEVLANGQGDGFVAGFDPDGGVRFARPIYEDSSESIFLTLALSPDGDAYVFRDTSDAFTTMLVDGHVISTPGLPSTMLLLRLTPDGRYASSALIAGSPIPHAEYTATDGAGASYAVARCSTRMFVQPEIPCDDGQDTSVIVSYDGNNQYQWATAVRGGVVEAMVAIPGNRMIVAGDAFFSHDITLGGVRVPSDRLFIAALAGGAARPPSPLPAAPVVTSVQLDGQSDLEIRQSGTGTLVIQGTGLDHVTSARLGDIDIHVPPGAGTADVLRLPVTIPHGHAPGLASLVLGNAGGTATAAQGVQITQVIVTPSALANGRGTPSSPMPLCGTSWENLVGYGDVIALRDGAYTCATIFIGAGVTLRGATESGTIVRGSVSPLSGHLGATTIENLTIESSGSSSAPAIAVGGNGEIDVTDVTVRATTSPGLSSFFFGGVAVLRRVSFEQNLGSAIAIFGGRVDAGQVDITGHGTGISVEMGALSLADSAITTDGIAVMMGTEGSDSLVTEATIARSTLRSNAIGIEATRAQLTVRDSAIEAAATTASNGVSVIGGSINLTGTNIRGWPEAGLVTDWLPLLSSSDPTFESVTVTLDQVEITGSRSGISYNAGILDGSFRMRRAHVTATQVGVALFNHFTAADLGTVDSPGDNQIAVDSGDIALDVGGPPGADVNAHGTMLNGASVEGDVQGPAELAGRYRIAADALVRF